MYSPKLSFLFFCVLISNVFTGPVIIRSGIANNGAQFDDASNSAASIQKGISNLEADEGFNKLYQKHLLDSALNSRYGEQSNVNKNFEDASHFNKGIVSNTNGAEGATIDDKTAHKKGHHKNGFHNSYHKDEVGSNSSFYDDGESEGGQHVFKNNQGSYANALEDNKRGDHSDRAYYNNERGDQSHNIKGNNYASDVNNQQNHNRKNYYDDRLDANQRNSGRRYGEEKHYNEENHLDRPHEFNPNIDASRRRITIFEDPRYEIQPNHYNDDYIELDVRPARRQDFRERPPFDYY